MPWPTADRGGGSDTLQGAMTAWLFTCRHTYEPTLVEELARQGLAAEPLLPGLVQAAIADPPELTALCRHDPVYALQVLPAAVQVRGGSIKELAQAAVEALLPILDPLEGPWDLHALVPAQLRGNPQPPLRRRADLLAEAVLGLVQQRARRLARRRTPGQRPLAGLAQILLVDAELAWVSASPVLALPPAASWPSPLPAGLAEVADDRVAPASSFRKLEEALACLGELPQPGQTAVDLGASPGGWTRVLRRHGAEVTAVDRAPLARHLMVDPQVHWVQGDAFTWAPPQPVDWLVSDVIAYPERVAELLDRWGQGGWMRRFVVQMKFKGEPDWQALAAAQTAAERQGWQVRAKHFFNDKNEITLMGMPVTGA